IPWWYFQRQPGELADTHLETVDPGGVIGRSIEPARVIGCVVYPAADLVGPGVVRHVEGDRFSLGEIDGTESARCRSIAEGLSRAGLKAPVTPRIRDEIWVKLLGNAVFNPISALTRAPLNEMAESPVTVPVVRAAMEELSEGASRADAGGRRWPSGGSRPPGSGGYASPIPPRWDRAPRALPRSPRAREGNAPSVPAAGWSGTGSGCSET